MPVQIDENMSLGILVCELVSEPNSQSGLADPGHAVNSHDAECGLGLRTGRGHQKLQLFNAPGEVRRVVGKEGTVGAGTAGVWRRDGRLAVANPNRVGELGSLFRLWEIISQNPLVELTQTHAGLNADLVSQ